MVGIGIIMRAVFLAGRQIPTRLSGMDRSVVEFAAASVADQAATGEHINDGVQQRNRNQNKQAKPQLANSEQDHGAQGGKDHEPESDDLRKIFAYEQLAATANGTSTQRALII